MGALIFITTEVYPFDKGGIGRFFHNLLNAMTPDERSRTIVLNTGQLIDQGEFSKIFEGAQIISRGSSEWRRALAGASASELNRLTLLDEWMALSIELQLVLHHLSVNNEIDYVEFPDWSGLAFATLQERKLNPFLEDANVAIRLHSCEAILVAHESRVPREVDLLRYDLERKSLRDCDTVIAHLQAVADANRAFFGFPESEWDYRVVLDDMPVELEKVAQASQAFTPDEKTAFVFSSKFQEFKRPETFLEATCDFVANHPDHNGKIIFACHGSDSEFGGAVLSNIPTELSKRVEIAGDLPPDQREALISRSVVVFPSSYESFCLAAYEASLSGARVVLNEQNPAFGDVTPWLNLENCIKFDGTSTGMKAALSVALDSAVVLRPVSLPSGKPRPWTSEKINRIVSGEQSSRSPLSIVVAHHGDIGELEHCLDVLSREVSGNDKIIVVTDAVSDRLNAAVVEELTELSSQNLKVAVCRTTSGTGALIARGLEMSTCDHVMFLTSSHVVRPGFLAKAAKALDRHSDVAAVIPQTGLVAPQPDPIDPSGPHEFVAHDVYCGEALVSSLGANNAFGSFGMVCRRAALSQMPIRSELEVLAVCGLLVDIAHSGARMIVTSDVQCLTTNSESDYHSRFAANLPRLRHRMIAGSPTLKMDTPVTRLGIAAVSRQRLPQWYRHAVKHDYVGIVEYVADFLASTSLGKSLRRNTRLLDRLERVFNLFDRR